MGEDIACLKTSVTRWTPLSKHTSTHTSTFSLSQSALYADSCHGLRNMTHSFAASCTTCGTWPTKIFPASSSDMTHSYVTAAQLAQLGSKKKRDASVNSKSPRIANQSTNSGRCSALPKPLPRRSSSRSSPAARHARRRPTAPRRPSHQHTRR